VKTATWPREYRHTLSRLIYGLIAEGFVIRHVPDSNDFHPDPNAAPETWNHFIPNASPWLAFWAAYRLAGAEPSESIV
jgi:hypothetical protein